MISTISYSYWSNLHQLGVHEGHHGTTWVTWAMFGPSPRLGYSSPGGQAESRAKEETPRREEAKTRHG